MKRLLTALLALPLAAAAEYPDLPPTALAERAILGHPAVAVARAGVDVGTATRDGLEAGPHEFNLRLGSGRRREPGLDRVTQEKEFGIERGLRLPGKAAKDAAIGTAVADEADSRYGDALHETARLLLRTWFDWRREQAALDEWQAQVALLEQQSRIAAKRVAVGDAARLEELLVSAQLVQGQAQLAQAESRLRLSADSLAQHFPSLPLPAQVGASQPERLAEPFASWREKILAHSHELRAARAATRVQQLQAQRADADRIPDPTLGVRWASERDGQERVLGVALSIPLPGGARAATARGAQAESAAAGAREALALARVEAEARRTFQQADLAYANWQRLDEAAQRISENALLLEKAWRLGEGQIADLLAARRQSIEARLAAAQARLDAAEARYRLLLDTHELWSPDAHAAD